MFFTGDDGFWFSAGSPCEWCFCLPEHTARRPTCRHNAGPTSLTLGRRWSSFGDRLESGGSCWLSCVGVHWRLTSIIHVHSPARTRCWLIVGLIALASGPAFFCLLGTATRTCLRVNFTGDRFAASPPSASPCVTPAPGKHKIFV